MNSVFIIVANILSLISNGLNGASSFFKSKKAILSMQVAECVIGGISQIFANSLAAAGQLFICAIRNIIVTKEVNKNWIYWIFSGVFLIIGVLLNNRGLIGFLPIIATIQYTLWCGYCKSAQGVRYGMIINYIPWIIHDFIVKIYISAAIMTISLILVVINVIRYRGKEEKNENN